MYEQDKLDYLQVAKEAGGFYLNPFHSILYNPGAYNIGKGTISYNANTLPVKAARGLGKAIAKGLGQETSYAKFFDKTKSSIRTISGNTNLGYKGEFSFDDLFRVKSNVIDPAELSKIKSRATGSFDDFVGTIKGGKYKNLRGFNDTLRSTTLQDIEVLKKSGGNKVDLNTLKKHVRQLKNNVRRYDIIKDVHGKQQTAAKIKLASHGISPVTTTLGKISGRVLVTAGKAASIVGLATIIGSVAGAVGTPIGANIAKSFTNAYDQYTNIINPTMGGSLGMGYLSNGAATERQRAIQAIQRSQINGRGAMGKEASYMHS